jgi:hypothetical protein
MSDTEERMSTKDILGGLIGGALIIIVGINMIINLDGASTDPSVGGKRFFKDLMNYIWSTPGGIVVVIIGLLIAGATVHQLYGQRKNKKS